MITSGYVRHGAATPLTNAQIISAHPELSNEKIDTMRQAFDSNRRTRPFALPIESNSPLSESDIERALPIQDQIYSSTQKVAPLQVRETPKSTGTLTYNSPVSRSKSSVPFVTPTQPNSANPGDLWYNTKAGKLFLFIKSGTQTYWVET